MKKNDHMKNCEVPDKVTLENSKYYPNCNIHQPKFINKTEKW